MDDNNISEKLYNQFNYCAIMLLRSQHTNFHEQFHNGPVNRGQRKLLGILLEKDGISQKEIVEIMDIRPSSVGELVSKLEQRGYVELQTDENDKRVSNIFLTETGRKMAEQSTKGQGEISGNLFSGLTMEEQQQLSDLLEKLIESLKSKAEQERGYDVYDGLHHRGRNPHDMFHSHGFRDRGFPKGHGFGRPDEKPDDE